MKIKQTEQSVVSFDAWFAVEVSKPKTLFTFSAAWIALSPLTKKNCIYGVVFFCFCLYPFLTRAQTILSPAITKMYEKLFYFKVCVNTAQADRTYKTRNTDY